ncbi:IS3 family transposase [Streptomyces yunnanensis]|uniref:Integrase core domain-containing protein n=1 Tax=Streptomyces yunnanensis TaxID=156453 RepID=A0A9X8R097_9ACTN|nr:hypothetical protein SAMN05216268_1365 [Streptomyces yunnanensis]
MGSVGDGLDNARAENLWSTIKTEGIRGRTFTIRAEANLMLSFEHIDGFCNSRRIQKRLGYLSQIEYEEKYYTEQAMAKQANLNTHQPVPTCRSAPPTQRGKLTRRAGPGWAADTLPLAHATAQSTLPLPAPLTTVGASHPTRTANPPEPRRPRRPRTTLSYIGPRAFPSPPGREMPNRATAHASR